MRNKMKTIITVLLITTLSTYAKSQSGIYMNLADFKNNKLTYENNCVNGKAIHIHDFFWNMPKIKVKHDGKKITFRKSELYGYRDCNSDVYRFFHNTEYRIAEAGNIYIYVQEKNITQNKGYKVVNSYYFSTTPDGTILPLTFGNLENAFASNEKFISLLYQYFKSEVVHAYDKSHNTFKVNYV